MGDSVRETIFAINWLAGFRDVSCWPAATLNLSQANAVRRVRRLHAEDHADLFERSDEEALRALLKTGGGYSSLPGGLASYSSGTLSKPLDQVTPCDPLPWLQGECLDCLSDPLNRMLLSDRDRAAFLDSGELPGLYVDPVRKRYGTVCPLCRSTLEGEVDTL